MSENTVNPARADKQAARKNLLITFTVVTGLIVVNTAFITAGWIYGSSEGHL